MSISKQISRITWIMAAFLVLILIIQQFIYFKTSALLQEEAEADAIVVKITSFLLYQKEMEDGDQEYPLAHWKETCRQVEEISERHPALNQSIQDELDILSSTIDELTRLQANAQEEAISQADQLIFELSNIAAKRVLAESKKYSAELSAAIKQNILYTNLAQSAIILLLLLLSVIFLIRFLRKTSQSLENLVTQTKALNSTIDDHTKRISIDADPLHFNEIKQLAREFNGLLNQLDRAVNETRLNAELLEGIFNSVNLGLCQVDETGRFVKVNDEYCRIYGFQREELLGQNFTITLPLKTRQDAMQAFEELWNRPAGQNSLPAEWQVINKQGEVLDILSTSTYIQSKSERHKIVSVLDISAYKDEKNKLTVAVESGKIGTWFLDLRTGKMTVNKYWATMLGLELQEVMGDFDFFINRVHPDDVEKVTSRKKALENPDFSDFSIKLRMRCKDGTYKWILDSGMVTRRDKDGKALVLAGTHIDLNEEVELRAKLKAERDRLKGAQDIGQLGDWTYDLHTGEITWSEYMYEIFECDKTKAPPSFEVLLGYFSQQEAQELNQHIQRTVDEGKAYDIEHSISVNGAEKHIRSIGEPVFDDSGKVSALKGITLNITKRVNAEREKNQSLNRLNALANNIPGAIFQYKLDANGKDQMLYVSEGARDLWGYAPEEIMNNNQLVWKQFHEKDLEQVQKSIERSAANLSTWEAEWRNVNKDKGTTWLQGRGSPKKVGSEIIWDSIVLNITDKKKVALQLKEREAYLRSLYNNAFDGILSCDENGRLVYFNDILIEWVGQFQKPISPEDYPATFGLYTFDQSRLLAREELSLFKALKYGKVQSNRFVIKNEKYPEPRYVEANGSRIINHEGKTIGAMVIVRDISKSIEVDLNASSAVINALDKERTEIASELHDNITQTLGMGKMNLGNLAIDWPQLEGNQHFKTAKKMLGQAISDTRNLSHRIMPPSIKDFGLVTAVEELLEDMEQTTRLNIHFSYNETKRVDRDIEVNLFRVAQEALSNVMQHAEADNLWLSITFKEDWVSIKIEDDGKGIDHNYAQGKTLKGIGLITMRNRVNKLNGTFTIDSKDGGTRVNVEVKLTNTNGEN